ncbi:PREDICTED: steroid 17-alpha-hydroxylase/17,20 lyase-like [Nanorana parkeri]|uniref:steroid 17-alpha-hydroxylase/17,20 lyase-like n=1 Tax=Nanorana parkeri TaxID=125878 RepID=UPI0008540662|nr:PREDICTED: steroid 17-alpha-hydroxylase/17,20 lyase-like [Nanorana parkeri]
MIVWLGTAAMVLVSVLFLISFWRIGLRNQRDVKYPKSLPSLPVIGSLLHLENLPPHLLFYSLQKKYGKLYSLKMGSQQMVIVNNHEDAREVLVKKGKSFAGRPHTVTTDILTKGGKGVVFATFSPSYQFNRKMARSALCMFGEGTLAIEEIVSREATVLCQTLASSQGVPLDMAPEIIRAVTNVVGSLCFNARYNKGDAEFETLMKYHKGIVDTAGKDIMVDIFPWLQIFPNKDLNILREAVAAREQLLSNKLREHKETFCSESPNDMMDVLLKTKVSVENSSSISQGVGMPEDEILMTVGDVFGAGVEVPSTALKWALALLLHHPQVQKKIQKELDTKIGFERYPLLSDRKILHYMEATIAEVMRFRPASPVLPPHVALKESSIGEYTIPKDARVIINLWSLHFDEKEWVNPHLFNPDRFLDENGNRINPSQSYLPFSTGLRTCLGESLTKMEMFLFLSWILQRFTLEVPEGDPLPDLDGIYGLVLQIKPFRVIGKLRDVWKNVEINT